MESSKTENEKTKLQEKLRKIQQSLSDSLKDRQYWGLDQKVIQIQRHLSLQERI